MKIQDNEIKRLDVNSNLIILERGTNELLLLNSFSLQPLYIKTGRDYVKALIRRVEQIRDLNEIQREFPNDNRLLETLIRHHILIPESEATRSAHTPPLDKMSQKNSAMTLYLLLSQSCNLGCIYCLNGTRTYRTGEKLKMGEEVAFRSVEKCLERLDENGTLEIAFFGGEPLLNWPLAKKVIKYCEDVLKRKYKDKKIKYHITSNLSFLPNDLIEWAKKYRISFLCDVDGVDEIHNICRPYKGGKPSHSDIVRNIGRLIQAGLYVSLRATLTSINQHQMVEIVKHHKEIGGRGSSIVPANPVNSDKDIMDDSLLPDPAILIDGLVDVYQSKIWNSDQLFPFSVYSSKIKPGGRIVTGCGAPYGNTPVVDVNGDVYPCIYLVGIKKFYMGNVLYGGYPDRTLLKWMFDILHVDNLKECKICNWRYMCGGGCPVLRLTVLNNSCTTPKVRDYCSKINCEYTKKILELLLWELAEEASLLANETATQKPSCVIEPWQTTRC